MEYKEIQGVLVSTRDYYHSHMKEPKGRGSWAFSIGEVVKDDIDYNKLWWSPSCTYAEARKLAIAEAKKRGVSYIEVCA